MSPPSTMGPPLSAPGKGALNSLQTLSGSTLGGGRHGTLDSLSQPKQSDDDEFVLEDAEDFNSPIKSALPKTMDIRPANGGQSPTQGSKNTSDEPDVDFGSAGGLGGQSAQSRARVNKII